MGVQQQLIKAFSYSKWQWRKLKLLSNLCEGMTLSNEDRSQWALLIRDASHPGKYRYQLFDASGFCSHFTSDTLEDALKDAFKSGYRWIDKTALDRVFGAVQWQVALCRNSDDNRCSTS